MQEHETIEQTVRSLWLKTLGSSDIPPDTNFFEAGGDSLAAVMLLTGILEEFDVALDPATFFASPTVPEMTEMIVAELR